MKILFTADLHINLHKKNVPYDWAISRYHALFEHYLSMIHEHNINLFVLGGDIFDKKPEFDELELYFELVNALQVKTIIYDGNHEATKKGKTFFSNLITVTELINPLVKVIDDITTIYGVDVVPFCKLQSINSEKHKKSNILLTHVRGNIPPHVKAELDLEKLKAWDIVLAGDLHNHENTQENIVYPGSPITTSFHRTEVKTGVIILDTDTLEYKFERMYLPQLIRKRISSTDSIDKTAFHHTIYEVEGNISELSSVDNSVLIDKKIIKRKFTPTLNLRDMTIEEEISKYCTDILKLSEIDINRLITIHKENNE